MSRPNLFSPEQEGFLGDAIHEFSRAGLHVLEAPDLTAPLSRIGERLLRHMPSSGLSFRFDLVDLPACNAFTQPGGRVYVTRKMVAFATDEDQLAGVLAHELGHALMHDGAVAATRDLQEVLGLTKVDDRRDVFEKYQDLLERRRGTGSAKRNADREQTSADAVGLYALARAGYRTEAFAELYDRLAETRGRTGNWLSDFVGSTPPDSQRLRKILSTQAALPSACREPRRPGSDSEFREWQAAVAAYDGRGHKETRPDPLWSRRLEPLEMAVGLLRFSPDGRSLLAQDEAGISVYSREPFALRFRIEADDAGAAQFSPDSRSVVFQAAGLKVERWDVASGERESVQEISRPAPCSASALSPDGRYLACQSGEGRLSLLEIQSGETALEHDPAKDPPRARPSSGQWTIPLGRPATQMAFSPSGRFFLAGAAGVAPTAFDLSTTKRIGVGKGLGDLLGLSFTFVGDDRIAGINVRDADKSALVRFPGGETISRLSLNPNSRLTAATLGDYLLIRPSNEFPVAVMDLASGKGIMANKRGVALDLYGDVFVNESGDGSLDLRRLGQGAAQALGRAALPAGALGDVRASGVSPDLKWLAVSRRSRGVVWNLESGRRALHVRAFQGAHFGGDGSFYGDFPGNAAGERAVTRMDPVSGAMVGTRRVEAGSGDQAVQQGSLLAVFGSARLQVRDAESGALLWSRPFPSQLPSVYIAPDEGAVTLGFIQPDGSTELELLAPRTGAPLGRVTVPTRSGSFQVQRVAVAGDRAVVGDSWRRTLVYDLSTGARTGRRFGRDAAVSAARRLLCVETEPGRLEVDSLSSLEKRAELRVPDAVTLARFTPDGARLFVLTSDQTVRVFDSSRW